VRESSFSARCSCHAKAIARSALIIGLRNRRSGVRIPTGELAKAPQTRGFLLLWRYAPPAGRTRDNPTRTSVGASRA
jgi:hypothetical protein